MMNLVYLGIILLCALLILQYFAVLFMAENDVFETKQELHNVLIPGYLYYLLLNECCKWYLNLKDK